MSVESSSKSINYKKKLKLERYNNIISKRKKEKREKEEVLLFAKFVSFIGNVLSVENKTKKLATERCGKGLEGGISEKGEI